MGGRLLVWQGMGEGRNGGGRGTGLIEKVKEEMVRTGGKT